ncbi:MAG: efflux RND transporter periplasmic adaptor subunit [Nitrospirae bacterium]|nr:MAG: efflux RND transporter periplasmic adaptor subunit [Nitrospirota bacterium]
MTENTRRRKFILILSILVGVLYFGYRVYEDQQGAVALQKETLELSIPTVAVIAPQPVEPIETITLPGTLQGWFEAPIFARVTGYVKMWYKDYGDWVNKGDVLAEINAPDLDAEYAQAKADLLAEAAKYKLAVVTAKRYRAMRKTHAVAEQTITVQEQNMRTQAAILKAAEQKVRNLEAFIRFKTIRAPFDGVVTQRNINVGDLVSHEGGLAGSEAKANLFTVADIHMMRLFVSVPERFGPFLKPGLTADVTVPQLPNRHFTAKFLTISRGFDVDTRTAVTIFTLDNKDRLLWPGSYAKVTLTAPVKREAFRIPTTALVFQEHGTQVAVVTEKNRVHFKPITIARILDNEVVVEKGVSVNDRVINNPSAGLLEGDPVRVVTPRPGFDLVMQSTAKASSSPQ